MARSKPGTEIDFGERMRWWNLNGRNSWWLLCDRTTVSLPAYIKGKAKRTLFNIPDGYWREVDHTKDHKAWQFIDQPGKPITAKDYLASG
jgi:hypothetical protein